MQTETHGPVANGHRGAAGDSQASAIVSHFRDLIQETTTLFHQEVELARAELNEKVDRARSGVASMAVAGGLTLSGIIILLFAAVFALGLVMDLWLASLILGGGATVLGLIVFGAARAALSPEALRPERTLRTLRRDTDLAREAAR